MKIRQIKTTPLVLPYKKPFHWAQGTITAAHVVLVEIHTDEGLVGYGECVSTQPSIAIEALLGEVSSIWLDADPFKINLLLDHAYAHLFASRGVCSAPRFGAQVLAGLDMALWDINGKAAGRPVHELMGGPVRQQVEYFGFPQGDTAEEIAADAARLAKAGFEVIYAKIGRGAVLDMEIAKSVREAIGDKRLRLDANEAWDILTATRMIAGLERFDVECIEQPLLAACASGLLHLSKSSAIPIAADQIAFTPEDVFSVCTTGAAKLIVLGLHETGGFSRFLKAAAIAEAAGINLCLHGLYESGITTCAANQVGAVISNLDDGNQYMNDLLAEDILDSPTLALRNGALPIISGPGLGFELNWDAVARANERHKRGD